MERDLCYIVTRSNPTLESAKHRHGALPNQYLGEYATFLEGGLYHVSWRWTEKLDDAYWFPNQADAHALSAVINMTEPNQKMKSVVYRWDQVRTMWDSVLNPHIFSPRGTTLTMEVGIETYVIAKRIDHSQGACYWTAATEEHEASWTPDMKGAYQFGITAVDKKLADAACRRVQIIRRNFPGEKITVDKIFLAEKILPQLQE